MIEKRGEPRFPVTSPIRVVVPGEGGHTMDSTLIDISGTGMRFLAPESMEAENVVAIEVDSRLILAEVRYCQPRGTRFVVGARRLHEIAKDAQLADAPAVVAEMLGHLRRHLAAGDAGDSQSLAVEALEKIVERREHPQSAAPPELAPEAQLIEQEPVGQSIDIKPIGVAPINIEPIGVEPIGAEYQEPELKHEFVSTQPDPVETLAPESVNQEPSEPEPKPRPAVEILLPKRQPPPVDSLEAVRQALGAEFERAAREPASRRRGSRKLNVALVLAASLILAAPLGYILYQRQSEAKPPAPVGAVPARIIAAPPKPEVHHAQIHVLKPTWLSLAIDGDDPFKSAFRADDTHPFDFSRGATLRVEDGAAVEITIDGNPVGPIAPGPQVVQINPQGVELVK